MTKVRAQKVNGFRAQNITWVSTMCVTRVVIRVRDQCVSRVRTQHVTSNRLKV